MTQEAFFGFVSRPFQASPQDEVFVPLEPIVDAIGLMTEAAVKGDGIGVLTAVPGSGKTVVCLQLQSRLERDFAAVLLPHCSFPTRRSLLQSILHGLGEEYSGLAEQETRLKLIDVVQSLRPDRAGLVVIADEAHQLGPRLLEELRCLTNHVDRGQPLIRVLLSGQLALEEQLTKPELQALNYRITCHTSLEPLTMQQSARYVDERLARVGGDACSLFSEDGLEMICRISDGNPRCLNQIADACLSYAAEVGQFTIGPSMVRLVLHELKQLPLQWNESACDQIADGDATVSTPNCAVVETDDIDAEEDKRPFVINDYKRQQSDTNRGAAAVQVDEPAWTNSVATIEIGGDAESPVDFGSPRKKLNKESEPSRRSLADETFRTGSNDPESTSGTPKKSLASTPDATTGTGDVPQTANRGSAIHERKLKPVAASATPSSSPRCGAVSHELQEIAVHDRYAALDRDSMGAGRRGLTELTADTISWSRQPSDSANHAATDRKQSLGTSTVPDQFAPDDGPADDVIDISDSDFSEVRSPEDKIGRMIQAVSDAVAHEIAADRPFTLSAARPELEPIGGRSGGALNQWRATPDPSAFDLIEPEGRDDESHGPRPSSPSVQEVENHAVTLPLNVQATESDANQKTGIDLADPPDADAGDPLSGRERPYARLFSRARRLRSRV